MNKRIIERLKKIKDSTSTTFFTVYSTTHLVFYCFFFFFFPWKCAHKLTHRKRKQATRKRLGMHVLLTKKWLPRDGQRSVLVHQSEETYVWSHEVIKSEQNSLLNSNGRYECWLQRYPFAKIKFSLVPLYESRRGMGLRWFFSSWTPYLAQT
jgi:hypothetical protein